VRGQKADDEPYYRSRDITDNADNEWPGEYLVKIPHGYRVGIHASDRITDELYVRVQMF
jgi:hypothetical protein